MSFKPIQISEYPSYQEMMAVVAQVSHRLNAVTALTVVEVEASQAPCLSIGKDRSVLELVSVVDVVKEGES